MGEDDIDRRAILARRAAFVSAALAALACNKADPPPQPPHETTGPVRPVEVDPGGTLEEPDVDASVPPLDVPPGIDEEDRVALEMQAKHLRPLYDQLEALRGEMPDCALPDPGCQSAFENYLSRLNQVSESIHFLHPLCGFSEDTRTVVAQRTGAHARYLTGATEALRDALRRSQATHGEEAINALGLLDSSRAVSMPCLSCLAPSGLILAGRTIAFEHGSAAPGDNDAISRLAVQMSGFPGINVEVRGHADPSEPQGEALALSRANAVAAALAAAGVQTNRLVVRSFGTKLRVEAFDSESTRAANRRVDFEVQ